MVIPFLSISLSTGHLLVNNSYVLLKKELLCHQVTLLTTSCQEEILAGANPSGPMCIMVGHGGAVTCTFICNMRAHFKN